jgi:hypothetical protein
MSFNINTYTPNFVMYSDSPLPIIPSATSSVYPSVYPSATSIYPSATSMYPSATSVYTTPSVYTTNLVPTGATVIIPGPVTLPTFLDLNKDSRVQKQVSKYFMYKTLDKWLYDDMSDLFDYFKVDVNGARLLHNLSEHSEAKKSPEDVEKIISYVEQYILTYDTMKRILTGFVASSKANWYDLQKNEYFVKEIIHKKLLGIIKATIAEQKK